MRCPECATDNPQDYRFCGMCGTPLGKSEPVPASAGRAALSGSSAAPERTTTPSTSLSGPSFLGLGGDGSNYGSSRSSRDLDYLFDEEPPKRTYWRFTLLLLILAVLGGLGWLQYTRNGKAWVAPWSSERAKASEQTNPSGTPDAASQTPAPPPNSQAAMPLSEALPQGSPDATNKAGLSEKDIPPAEGNSDTQSAAEKETGGKQESATDKTSDATSNDESALTADSPSKETEDSTPAEAKPAKFAAKVPKTKPAPSKPLVSEDDALVANAEKYLYGRGVPQNCDRALSSLRAAAQRQNSRARSLLGSMYATGHCVPRDLPNAYRWFALASRDSSDNMWVQRNLEMIWREMTPQERQLAIQRNQ